LGTPRSSQSSFTTERVRLPTSSPPLPYHETTYADKISISSQPILVRTPVVSPRHERVNNALYGETPAHIEFMNRYVDSLYTSSSPHSIHYLHNMSPREMQIPIASHYIASSTLDPSDLGSSISVSRRHPDTPPSYTVSTYHPIISNANNNSNRNINYYDSDHDHDHGHGHDHDNPSIASSPSPTLSATPPPPNRSLLNNSRGPTNNIRMVIRTYQGQSPHEIDLLQGDLVIVDKEEFGWAEGTNITSGMTGRFPTSHIDNGI